MEEQDQDYKMEWPEEESFEEKKVKYRYKDIEIKQKEIFNENEMIHYLSLDDKKKREKFKTKKALSTTEKKETPPKNKLNIYNYRHNNLLIDINDDNANSSENHLIKSILKKLENSQRLSNKSRGQFKINLPKLTQLNRITSPKKKIKENGYSERYKKNFCENDSYAIQHLKFPKINNILNKNRNFDKYDIFDNSNDIFKITNCSIISNRKYETHDTSGYHNNNNLGIYESQMYSPSLGKNLTDIFTTINDNEKKTILNAETIRNGVREISRNKLLIDSYKPKKKIEKNFPLLKIIENNRFKIINSFNDIGKVKNVKEIENTLFKRKKKLPPLKKSEKKSKKKSRKKKKKRE